MKKIGMPEVSKSGFLALGGGGFIDVPFITGLRIGGIGTGYSDDNSSESANNIIKNVRYSYTMGGVFAEYVTPLSRDFNLSFGGMFGIGFQNIHISRYTKDLQNWNISYTGNDTLLAGKSNSYKYSSKVYSFAPQVGIGYQVLSFLYIKFNASYMFSVQKKWKLDDVFEVDNVPSGIKADGFNFNIGIFGGLFVK